MTTLSVEKHFNIFDKSSSLQSVMSISDSGKSAQSQEKEEQNSWWKNKLFSPARDIRNSPHMGENSLMQGGSHQMGLLKFHPYARDRCTGPDMFRHILPYIPPNMMATSGSTPQSDASGEALSAACKFNPFSNIYKGMENNCSLKQVENRGNFPEEPKSNHSKTEEPEKNFDKMASKKEKEVSKQSRDSFLEGKIIKQYFC